MLISSFIWQQADWPQLRVDASQVEDALSRARRAQGIVEGQLAALGVAQHLTLEAEAWSQDAMATAAIEGERYDLAAVRSSVARRLGLGDPHGPGANRDVEGLLDVMDDVVRNATSPLTHERLQGWQAALFPGGYSGMRRIHVGGYRHCAEPMQIVSGPVGREKVHDEAPPSAQLPVEMEAFVSWFNSSVGKDPLVTAALSHVWFETIHPFEDGNGRIGRALIDLVIAREMGAASRMIRISQRLLAERRSYYAQLEIAQRGSMDVTPWVSWFLEQVRASCEEASGIIGASLAKALFWSDHDAWDVSPRQRKVLNVLLDAGPGGFEGGMSPRKYENIGATSRATASRELSELEELGLLRRVGAGRSTRYYLSLEGWGPPDPASLPAAD